MHLLTLEDLKLLSSLRTQSLIASDLYLLVLLGILIYFFGFKRIRSVIPISFEAFCNTSFPLDPNNKIDSNEVDNEFKRKNDGRSLKILGDRFIDSSKTFTLLVKQSISERRTPSLIIGKVATILNLDLSETPTETTVLETYSEVSNVRLLHPHLGHITFTAAQDLSYSIPIFFTGARILSVEIDTEFRGSIYFRNCWIGSLLIKRRSDDKRVELDLTDTFIGSLNLEESCCSTFSMNGGGIRQLQCPSAAAKTPVLSSFQINTNVCLIGSALNLNDKEIANYRNLALHIKSNSHPLTQQIVNSVVYRLERQSESGLLKFVNYCYSIFSAYNTQPGLPIKWIILTFASLIYLTYVTDMAILSKGCLNQPTTTWIDEMCRGDDAGRLNRSVAFAFNTYISPLSALSDTALLKTRSLYFHIFAIFLGLMNLLWATLAIFSIKTRFTGKQ
jgi:hypothetical protein